MYSTQIKVVALFAAAIVACSGSDPESTGGNKSAQDGTEPTPSASGSTAEDHTTPPPPSSPPATPPPSADAGTHDSGAATGGKAGDGATCKADGDCASGVCFAGGQGSYCTYHCTTANAATACKPPVFNGVCNKQGFCRKP